MNKKLNDAVMRTDRLLIRPVRMEDANDLYVTRAFPEVYKQTSKQWTSLKDAQDWIAGFIERDDGANSAIELLHHSSTVNTNDDPSSMPDDLHDRPPHHPRVIGAIGAIRGPEIGYMLHPHVWRRGLATEALRAYLAAFWARTDYEYAEAMVDPANPASRRTLEKCGFREWDYRIKDYESPWAGWSDTVVYRITRPTPDETRERQEERDDEKGSVEA